MPQFQQTAFFLPQVIWLAITFITLYIVMATVALPKIGAVLDERQRRIDDNLDRAAQLKAEAEAAVAAYEKALAESRAHAHKVIKEASDRMTGEAEERSRALAARLAGQIKDGEARIAAAKDTALAGVKDVALDVAGAVIARLLGSGADQSQLGTAVAGALKEHGQ